MSENTEKQLVSRCPVCYSGGIDIYLVKDKDIYRCIRCSFMGAEGKVLEMYDDFRKRYRRMGERVTLEEQRGM